MTSRTEEEELAVIRDWWQRNGRPLITGSALALVLVFGWQGWQEHKVEQAEAASLAYQDLLASVLVPSGEPDSAKVAEVAAKLQQEFPGTAYAQYASLFVAKVAVETGKLDDAARELQLVLDKPFDATLGELARQRLARVLAAQGKSEDGLKLLAGEAEPAFLASREELRGDLLVMLKRADEARAAYEKAKAALSQDAALGGLQMKLDDLAQGDA